MSDDLLAEISRIVDSVELIDHHVHGPWRTAPDRRTWVDGFVEADTEPSVGDADPMDSQIGLAVRAWCAPILDLPRHASVEDYWRRRVELGHRDVTRRFLAAAGVTHWLVDTGFAPDDVLAPAELAATAGSVAHEIVRLEVVAETLAAEGVSPAAYPDAFRVRLAQRTAQAVGTKTILAYRCGFDVDLSRPGDEAVVAAYERWRTGDPSPRPRLIDPVLIAFGMHEAIELGLPLQVHVGLGDRDVDLRTCDPLLLTDFLRTTVASGVPITLLHCYPFERQAGFLAQAFSHVHLDVGLAVNHLGSQSAALIERVVELPPLRTILYSSDAFGPPELHYLGARLWRTGLTRMLHRRVADDDWSIQDAARIAELTGRGNALRVYRRLGELED